jgi:hypothetical protein
MIIHNQFDQSNGGSYIQHRQNQSRGKEDAAMRTTNALLGVGAIIAALAAGCAEVTPQDSVISQSIVAPKPVSQREAANQAFEYRRQAAELRGIARRLELETNIYKKQGGEPSERTRAGLEQANAMWAAAEEAEQVAREYQRQVPHGQAF